ncbi:MAG: polyphosphate polymerase domain-containing protein, partial [Actinobacteria bacterium]|nr:polyphosphate polymerase domain-containing protein [Actinomycetota bacterium]
ASDTIVFVEIKKKFKGVVYKRRVAMTYAAAKVYLSGVGFLDACALHPAFDASGHVIEPSSARVQISREIDWMRARYIGLEPAMFISCEREAYFCLDDENLRITFDKDILWRDEGLDFAFGAGGHPMLSGDERIMEIKCAGPFPLWLTHLLSELKVYPNSFSKYGNAHKASFSEFMWEVADDMTFSAATQKMKGTRDTRVTEEGGVRCA